jgi:formate dehydrogenase major subunit
MKLARTGLKTNNISLDSDSGHRASLDVLSAGTGFPGMTGSIEEISKSKFILVLGIDITKQNPIIGSEIHKAARAGATVVTVDSRRTQIAKLSTEFIQVKPGSSALVLLAMARTIAEEKLADEAFIKKYAEGYDDFRKSFEMLPENEVAGKAGVSPEAIKNIARKLAGAESAMVFFSSGISGLDEDTIGCIYNLYLMSGKIGKEGCGVNPLAGLNNLQGGYDMGCAPDLLTGFQALSDAAAVKKFNKEWGVELDTAPGASVHDMLADPSSKLKALIVADHDEGIMKYAERYKKLEFVAYIGAYKNAFTEYAHVVLPIGTYVEDDATFTNTERRVQLSAKKIEPGAGVLPGWKLVALLAAKAGLKWNYAASAAVMDEIARLTPSYSGISHSKLASGFGIQWPCDRDNPDGTKRFDVKKAGRKLAFVKVSGVLEIPDAREAFPFLLMVGKAQHYWHQNNLMKKTYIPMREYNATLLDYPQGYVEISAESAKQLQVRDRWPVKVISPHGEMRITARVTEDVAGNTAYAPYFVQDMISQFLLGHTEILKKGEDATIPVRIEKV